MESTGRHQDLPAGFAQVEFPVRLVEIDRAAESAGSIDPGWGTAEPRRFPDRLAIDQAAALVGSIHPVLEMAVRRHFPDKLETVWRWNRGNQPPRDGDRRSDNVARADW